MILVMALLAGLPQADLIHSAFLGAPRHSEQPSIVAARNGSTYIVQTVVDIASLENPSLIPVGHLYRLGQDDTLLWEVSLRSQTLTGAALGPQDSVFVAGYSGSAGFISRYDAGGQMVWSSLIEGQPAAIASDSEGNVYATGIAGEKYAATPGAFQTSRGSAGCATRSGEPLLCPELFVTKLSPDGKVVFGTFLGGTLTESATGIAVGADRSVYVVGETTSADFPTTPGAAQPTLGGVVNLGPLSFGDGFAVRFDPLGSHLLYGTYIGGPLADRLNAVAVDASGNAMVVGSTEFNHNIMPSAFGAGLVVRLDPGGRSLRNVQFRIAYPDAAISAAMSPNGRYFVSLAKGGIHELDPETLAVIRTAPLLADGPASISAAWNGTVSIAAKVGQSSTNYFAVPPGQSYYGSLYYAKYDFGANSRPYVSAIVNAASYAMGRRFSGSPVSISPNEIVTLFGYGLTGSVQVMLDGKALPVLFASEWQVNVRIPDDIPLGTADFTVRVTGATLGPWKVEVARAVPALFTAGNAAAAINEDGTVNSPEHPAPAGSIVQLFATGLGPLDGNQRLASPFEVYDATGSGMEVLYGGAAPGLPGVQQLNVRIRPGTDPSPRSMLIKVIVGTIAGYEPTQDNVAIYVQ